MESLQVGQIGEAPRLVVVIGNTTTTMALFHDGPEPVVIEHLPSAVFDDAVVMAAKLEGFVRKYPPVPGGAAICSVVPDIAVRCAGLLEGMLSVPVLLIGATLRLPFSLNYENSKSFGADRIALCAWSRQLFPQQAHIAVDIGTAITFDVLDSKGAYVGGLIMPGLDMMSGALHSRTAQLPLVSIEKSTNLLGRSTGECIRSGIFWGAVKQIDGLIEEITSHLREQYGEASAAVIATGGNSRLIAGEISSIDVVDELAVVRGSRYLLDLNLT